MRKHKSTTPAQEIKNPFEGKNSDEIWAYVYANLQHANSDDVRKELMDKVKAKKQH